MVLLLTDHVAFAIEREEQGIHLPNLLLSEIKILYHKGYQTGVQALKYTTLKTEVHLPLDEAGFVTMYIIDSGNQDHKSSVEEILTFSKQILHIIEVTMHIGWKEEDFDQTRLAVHLKYLGQWVPTVDRTHIKQGFSDKMCRMMLKMNPEMRSCLKRMKSFVKHNYDYELDRRELFYTMAHTLKILS